MTAQTQRTTHRSHAVMSTPKEGERLTIGTGFEALSFRHREFEGLMDPLIMVDHFTMTEPTFGAHAHAGLSAVSVLFEDSEGTFRNRDSLGNDIELAPGDLYWLKAGRGAVHDEAPTPGSRTHALQIFVNLPAHLKHDVPESLHVAARQMPTITGAGYRARVMLGESNGTAGAASPSLPLTILDVAIGANGEFIHSAGEDQAIWVHTIRGNMEVLGDRGWQPLGRTEALALHGAGEVRLRSSEGGQAVVLSGAPIREPFVQKGPFAMSSSDQLAAVIAAYEAGELGSID